MTTPPPLVSVVIPSHNRDQLLARALRSVARQTYANIEVIVVDDASDVPIPHAVGAGGRFDLRVVRRQSRGGPAAARNSAAADVRGEFVAFLDSDDEWLPTKVETQLDFLLARGDVQQPRLTICGFERRTGAKRWTVAPPHDRVYRATDLLSCATVPLTASVMMLDAGPFRAGSLRFDEQLLALEDLDFAVQAAAAGTVMCQHDVLTVKHRDLGREHAYTDAADLAARDRMAAKYEHVLRSDSRAMVGFQTRRIVGLIATNHAHEAAAVAQELGDQGGPLRRMACRATASMIQSSSRGAVRHAGRLLLRLLRATDRWRRARPPVDQPIKVVFTLPNLEVGGVQRAHLLIGRYLDPRAVQPIFVSLHPRDNDDRPSLQSVFEGAGLEVRDLGLRGRADRSFWPLAVGAWRLRRLCRAERVHIVESCIVEADLIARFATVGTKTLHVTHLVNTTYDDAVRRQLGRRSRVRLSALRHIDALTGRLTTTFVALTDGVAESARRHLRIAPTKLVVISRGVDLEEFERAESSTTHDKQFRILSVARLAPSKGHEATIQAVAHLREWGIEASLVVAGDGPNLNDLRQLAADLDLEAQVTFAGAVDFRTVRQLLADADVFCFPSRWEGQGNALLEAMAAGRPIVASNIATLREVLGESGVLVETEDPLALAEGLRRVAEMTPEQRAALGHAARQQAEERFDARDRVRDLQHLYGQLRAGRRPTSSAR